MLHGKAQIAHHSLATPAARQAGGQGDVADYVLLLKPRVMSLVVFSAVVGLVAAPGSIHPWLGFVAILCIALGAGASGALNMWFDADIDALMKRTAARPVPSGAIAPGEALGFGLTLSAAAVLLLGLLANLLAAGLLALTIFYYVVIYTMWLKRWTPQNIVIGGAAGAFPPMIGWAAATGTVEVGSIALFLLIFFWTPPHFWALALFREGDYGKAGVPMLPNVAGRGETKKQILYYSLGLLPVAALPLLSGIAGSLYAIGATALTLNFLWLALAVRRASGREAEDKAAKKLFGFSIIWLFAVLLLVLGEHLLGLPLWAAVI
jgi:protoheme IX farnesyltransferase